MTIKLSELKEFATKIGNKQAKISENGLCEEIAEHWDVGSEFSINSRFKALLSLGFIRRSVHNAGVLEICLNGARRTFKPDGEEEKIGQLTQVE